MIVLEFVVFVVSSGLFCSERFRNHLWAVVVAGVIATGSSLLFMWDLGAKVAGHGKEPPAVTRIIRQTVERPVLTSQPAAASANRPHDCTAFYPPDSAARNETGVTRLAFKILTDGTVGAIRVTGSSGSTRLDDAATRCVASWHYTPAIKDGKLAEAARNATIRWVMPATAAAPPAPPANVDETKDEPHPAATAPAATASNNGGRHWYDPRTWFSGESDNRQPSQPQQ